VFFLSLAVLASLIIPLWVTLVTGRISLPLAMPAPYWHQHEMLFGFLSAAIAGFLLTAVCVWTGTERTHGTRLLLLSSKWVSFSFVGDEALQGGDVLKRQVTDDLGGEVEERDRQGDAALGKRCRQRRGGKRGGRSRGREDR
jgi:Uncharacterized protein involved in response to NO